MAPDPAAAPGLAAGSDADIARSAQERKEERKTIAVVACPCPVTLCFVGDFVKGNTKEAKKEFGRSVG